MDHSQHDQYWRSGDKPRAARSEVAHLTAQRAFQPRGGDLHDRRTGAAIG